MKMKKGSTIIGIIVAVMLVVGTITVFATSALENAPAASNNTSLSIISVNEIDTARTGVGVSAEDPLSSDGSHPIRSESTWRHAHGIPDNSSNRLLEIPQEATSETSAEDFIPPIEWEKVDSKIKDVIFEDFFGAGRVRLLSVGARDENKFTPEEWEIVMVAVEQGLVQWED
jgi:hypothetical protein